MSKTTQSIYPIVLFILLILSLVSLIFSERRQNQEIEELNKLISKDRPSHYHTSLPVQKKLDCKLPFELPVVIESSERITVVCKEVDYIKEPLTQDE